MDFVLWVFFPCHQIFIVMLSSHEDEVASRLLVFLPWNCVTHRITQQSEGGNSMNKKSQQLSSMDRRRFLNLTWRTVGASMALAVLPGNDLSVTRFRKNP